MLAQPCPFCGSSIRIFDNVGGQCVTHKHDTCCLSHMVFRLRSWNERANAVEENLQQRTTQQGTQAAKEKDAASGHC